MKLWQLITNVLLFQVTWISAAFGYEVYALVSLALLAASQIFSPEEISSVVFGVVTAIILGLCMDSALVLLGIYQFPDTSTLSILKLPYWLLIMWSAFSLTIFVSLYWALNRQFIFVILCAVMGPISYAAGRQLNIIEFANNDILIMVGAWASWAMIFLVICRYVLAVNMVSQKIERKI